MLDDGFFTVLCIAGYTGTLCPCYDTQQQASTHILGNVHIKQKTLSILAVTVFMLYSTVKYVHISIIYIPHLQYYNEQLLRSAHTHSIPSMLSDIPDHMGLPKSYFHRLHNILNFFPMYF
jgi:hypothetical protein